MDGEIADAGKCILQMLKRALCPIHVRDEDGVRLAAPWDDEDYRVGVYLYDIRDFSILKTGMRTKAIELSYMIFCKEGSRFGGRSAEREHGIMSEIVRAVYDNPVICRETGEEIQVSFAMENMDFKIRLWESFSKPLQPAVYVSVVPVLIASGRVEEITPVKDRDYRIGRKERKET